jgi:hypothetical protein
MITTHAVYLQKAPDLERSSIKPYGFPNHRLSRSAPAELLNRSPASVLPPLEDLTPPVAAHPSTEAKASVPPSGHVRPRKRKKSEPVPPRADAVSSDECSSDSEGEADGPHVAHPHHLIPCNQVRRRGGCMLGGAGLA